jgi:hypothetical protein
MQPPHLEISSPRHSPFPAAKHPSLDDPTHSVSCFPIRISLPVPGFFPVHVCEGTRLFFDQEIEVIIIVSVRNHRSLTGKEAGDGHFSNFKKGSRIGKGRI